MCVLCFHEESVANFLYGNQKRNKRVLQEVDTTRSLIGKIRRVTFVDHSMRRQKLDHLDEGLKCLEGQDHQQ